MIPYQRAQIDQIVKGVVPRGARTNMLRDVMQILGIGNALNEPHAEWASFCKSRDTRYLDDAKFEELATLLGQGADPDGFRMKIAPPDHALVRINTESDRRNAAIHAPEEVMIRYSDNRTVLIDDRWPIVSAKLSGQIDDVTFEYPGGGRIRGEYLVLGPAYGNAGAIVLPIDFRSERVAVVRQFRYPVGDFLYELPRGFAGPFEKPSAVALRELLSETGLEPLADDLNVDGEQMLRIHHLGDVFTDTSFLRTKPHLFLAEVDMQLADASQLKKPLHSYVTYLQVDCFYACLFETRRLEFGSDYVTSDGSDRGTLSLRIEDGMTLQAALLALPCIERRLGRAIDLPVAGLQPMAHPHASG